MTGNEVMDGLLAQIRSVGLGCRGAESWMAFHNAIQAELVTMGEHLGFYAEAEYKVSADVGGRMNGGRVDVYWRAPYGSGLTSVAIEIDSSAKTKSLRKLLALADRARPVWLVYAPRYPECVSTLDPGGKVTVLRMAPEDCVVGRPYTLHHRFLSDHSIRKR